MNSLSTQLSSHASEGIDSRRSLDETTLILFINGVLRQKYRLMAKIPSRCMPTRKVAKFL